MYTLSPPPYLSRVPHRSSTTPRCLAAPPPPPPLPRIAPPPRLVRAATAEDPSLRSTWSHRAWTTAGFASVLTALSRSGADSGAVSSPLLAALLGYLVADLGSGVYHWAVDNYGGPATPAFGPQIAAFQGHHRSPSTITRRHFANNLHSLARAVFFAVVPIELALGDGGGTAHAFVGACAGCLLLSQQFHAWAHTAKGRLPPGVAALQEAGVLISRKGHAAHHRAPYNGNYCIVSGVWNGVLDGGRVLEAAEMVLFLRFGVRPRSWSEPPAEWAEEAAAAAEATK